MTQPHAVQVPENRKESVVDFLTVQEVAEICRVSPATVKYWMALRKLRSVKLGKHPLIKREELLRFIGAAEAASGTNRVNLNSYPSHV